MCKQITEYLVLHTKRLEDVKTRNHFDNSNLKDLKILIEFMKKKINACFKLRKSHLKPIDPISYLQTVEFNEQEDLDLTIEVRLSKIFHLNWRVF